MQVRRVEPVYPSSNPGYREREKENEKRRQALLLKKAILQQMKKEEESIYKGWINRGR